MQKGKLFTIVVPVYNVERFLEQCLDSLADQTDKCFSVVLVNDGSTDSSGDIARKYAAAMPELFSLVDQENRGPGAARNAALKLVDSPYVTFLDSDDWWPVRNAEIASRYLQSEPSPDIVFTCPTVYDMDLHVYREWNDTALIKGFFERNGSCLSPETSPELYGTEASLCRAFFRTQMLREHDFSFPEGIKWEDVAPHFQLISWARRCVLAEDVGFVYRVNSGNQTTSTTGADRLDIDKAFRPAFDYAVENGWDMPSRAYLFQMLMSFVWWFFDSTGKTFFSALIDKLHAFANEIPNSFFKAYCRVLDPSKRDRFLWRSLKSPVLYRMLRTPEKFYRTKGLFRRLKHIKHKLLG